MGKGGDEDGVDEEEEEEASPFARAFLPRMANLAKLAALHRLLVWRWVIFRQTVSLVEQSTADDERSKMRLLTVNERLRLTPA